MKSRITVSLSDATKNHLEAYAAAHAKSTSGAADELIALSLSLLGYGKDQGLIREAVERTVATSIASQFRRHSAELGRQFEDAFLFLENEMGECIDLAREETLWKNRCCGKDGIEDWE